MDKEYEKEIKRINICDAIASAVAVAGMVAILCHTAKAEDVAYEGPHHFNVVFTTETTLQEVAWQALNVVDGLQTVYIAEHPAQWQEVGQAAAFVGNHPSKAQAIWVTALFAVGHYAVTVGLENLIQENPDYRVLQRVWQYSNLGYKAYTVEQNHNWGIKP